MFTMINLANLNELETSVELLAKYSARGNPQRKVLSICP